MFLWDTFWLLSNIIIVFNTVTLINVLVQLAAEGGQGVWNLLCMLQSKFIAKCLSYNLVVWRCDIKTTMVEAFWASSCTTELVPELQRSPFSHNASHMANYIIPWSFECSNVIWIVMELSFMCIQQLISSHNYYTI